MKRKKLSTRRPKHTQDELRELIVSAATGLIEEGGLVTLSAREIARRIGYSAGTLYNVFKDRDEIVLSIESRLLDRLAEHLDTVSLVRDPRADVMALANAYLAFTHANPNLWKILFEHKLSDSAETPGWYQGKIDSLLLRLEGALKPLSDGEGVDLAAVRARVLWAGVHGITSLSVAGKLAMVTDEAAQHLVQNLVATYLDGIEDRGDDPREVSPPPKASRKRR
ncbi:MAG: TetR/AcrR family transcriptional regulator [Alphaproteobacteria bacterium]|nr:TetR/AcrR family transcriptional regulator [Alphaproteobacteria bacterium]